MNAGMTTSRTKLACAVLALGAAAVACVAYTRQHAMAAPAVDNGPAGRAGGAAGPAGALLAASWALAPATRVTVLAGDGSRGLRDGAAAQARYADPYGVALDQSGNVYLADGGDNNRIRKIGADGVVSTLAGSTEGYADGAGAAAQFNTPSGLAVDAVGNLYVADTGNNAVRKVTPQGVVSTLAGNGVAGFRDGKGAAAQFNGPLGVAVDRAGVVYVADSYNDRIRRIAPDGTVTTLAGGDGPDNIDGPALQARFDTPCALAVAPDGTVLIADTRNDAIRKLGTDGQVSTLASVPDTSRDRHALLRRPVAVALAADGNLYIASAAHGRVTRMAPDGQLVALADVDHPAQAALADYGDDGSVRLLGPRGMALARDGALVLADAALSRVLRLAPALPGSPAAAASASMPTSTSASAPTPTVVSLTASASASPLQPIATPPRGEPMLWPVAPQREAHEVVGLMGEVRGNFDGESRDHFHGGLDVQAAIGTPVLAIAAAKVSDPLANWGYGTLSEGISIAGVNYIHMRVGRSVKGRPLDERFELLSDEKGKPDRVRVKRGTRFATGDTLGTVNAMAHVHLDYRPNGVDVNPLSLPFFGLRDTIAPQIQNIALLDAAGKPLRAKRGKRLLLPRALGDIGIAVEAYDQIDGDQARRRLGIYKLGYQLLMADGVPVAGYEQPIVTQVYDRLPRNSEMVRLAYAGSSGITAYGSKATRFVYALTNRMIGGVALPGSWHVAELAPGDYVLRILAADYAGNVAMQGRDLPITVE